MKVSFAEKLRTEQEAVLFSPDLIDRFALHRVHEGYARSSVVASLSAVRGFYKWLPENDKFIRPDSLQEWLDWQREKGRSPAALRPRKAVLNEFLSFVGRPEWRIERPQNGVFKTDDIAPPLSRSEYLSLLQAARDMGLERTYLIMKTMCGAGVNSSELSQVTVEVVQEGAARFQRYGRGHKVDFPEPLRSELLAYANRNGISSGPVFITKDGAPVLYSFIWKDIRRVCRQTCVDETKANPKYLPRLFQATRKEIQAKDGVEFDQLYQQLLEREERLIGWDI